MSAPMEISQKENLSEKKNSVESTKHDNSTKDEPLASANNAVDGSSDHSEIDLEDELPESLALEKFKSRIPKIEKATNMFADVFKSSIKDVHPGRALRLGHEIACSLYESHLPVFPKMVRTKLHNIRENSKLCKNIYAGHILIPDFINMSACEMKTDELKNKDDVALKDSLLAAQVAVAAAETEMFTCSKCKQKKCTYTQMQTRSCDEPMTTFVHCTVCGNRWRF